MRWSIRPTREADRGSVLDLVREAFSAHHDGREEVAIVLDTWRLEAGADGLDLVATDGEAIIGHVLGAWGDLAGQPVVGIAPLAVLPATQGQGVGGALMTELLSRADALGCPLVVLLGDPAYYSRFGFEPAGGYGITYGPVGPGDPHFQVRRLSSYSPALAGVFRYCWEIPGPPALPGA